MNTTLRLAPVLLAAICTGSAAASDSADSETVKAWQTAYSSETNSYQRHLAFAPKADEEGYGAVASLFRALARAEQIHYTIHSDGLTALAIPPQASVVSPYVESTKKNLEISASNGEVAERDSLYPSLIKRAKADGDHKLVQTFEAIRRAEAEHYKLLTAAIKNLNQMKGGPRTYYVCAASGFVATSPSAEECASDWETVK